MALIDVSQAQAGMVLSADILDKRGRILIPKGAELKEKHLGSLPAWGISRIDVEGEEPEVATELEPWALEAAEAEVAPRFALANRAHPAMQVLLAVSTRLAAARIQVTQGGPA